MPDLLAKPAESTPESAAAQERADRSFPWRRGVMAAVLMSVFWALLLLVTRSYPSVALADRNSDHYSHFGAAALALHHGSAVYQAPVRALCLTPQHARDPLIPKVLATSQALRVAPDDVCFMRSGATQVPLLINWGDFPRPYPPGNLLVFAPIGWAYAHAGLSFEHACAATMALILLFGHLTVLALAYGLRLETRGAAHDGPDWASWCVLGVAGLFVMGWAFAGFYDGLAIAPLCIAARAWIDRRPSLVVMAFGLAALAHFRALWFLPLAAAALWQCWSAHKQSRLDKTQRQHLAVGLLAGAVAALSLSWVAPFLSQFPANHPLHLSSLGDASTMQLGALALAGLSVAVAAMRGAKMLAACAGFILVMSLMAPQKMAWHAISLVPLLALVPPASHKERTLWLLGTLAFIELCAELFFGASLFPSWIAALFARF